MSDYACGKCTGSDCRGNPAYIDPQCPTHGRGQTPSYDEVLKAIEFFEKLKQYLDKIDYDPLSPHKHEIHLAAKHGSVLSKILKLTDEKYAYPSRYRR